jgi:uncharacterized membrane protein YhhN
MVVAVLGSFLLDWTAVAFGWRKIKPLAKVLAMISLILWTLFVVDWSPDILIIFLVLAQMFGLTGDILLLFPERGFFAGLGAFLVGHLLYAYLIFFDIFKSSNLDLSISRLLFPILITFVFWGVVLFAVYRVFKRDHFLQHRKGRLLWNLVQIYSWILSGLTALTVFRVLVQPNPPVQLGYLPLGGVLFLLSDIILAYDRFVKPIPRGQLWVHMTYHLGQFCLGAGFLMMMGHIQAIFL